MKYFMVFVVLVVYVSIVKADYCSLSGVPDGAPYITHFKIGTIDHASGSDVYSDFTDVSTDFDLTVTKQFPFTVTYSRNTVTGDGVAIWIDYNQDGNFTNTMPERAAFGEHNGAVPAANFHIDIPSTALSGKTRMRVLTFHVPNGVAADSCGFITDGFGEVEDYTVNIINPPPSQSPSISLSASRTPSISLSPSVTSAPSLSISPSVSNAPSISPSPTYSSAPCSPPSASSTSPTSIGTQINFNFNFAGANGVDLQIGLP
eukprot:TRINITY_DN3037_c0_g2_i1.p1 TRINITY_DN3037_c0_g2~~TRINITY_DN3037_c0_g2_i1.p1  ORF type:complete len:260 (-),score=55.44 TRINITY_DN3037_c0_g2_i1:72-851(-)